MPHIKTDDWAGVGYDFGYAYTKDSCCGGNPGAAGIAGDTTHDPLRVVLPQRTSTVTGIQRLRM
jgi:hypothetical protein